jgi:hypothetical protein
VRGAGRSEILGCVKRELLSTVVVAALGCGLAACGGSSSSEQAKKAASQLRQESIPAPNGGQQFPTSVQCKPASKGPTCTVTFPDGQVQDCFVSISGSDTSSSCNVDLNATKANRAKNPTTTQAAQTTTSSSSPTAGDPVDARRWQGRWKSTFGTLILHVSGGRVTGTYAYCDGRIVGVSSHGVLHGTWRESPSACNTNRTDPSTFTGGFTFNLVPPGNAFAGTWSYADASQNPSNVLWSGSRLR